MILTTIILPNWKIPFSIPLGIAIYNILLIIPNSGLKFWWSTYTTFFLFLISTSIIIAAINLETKEGIATPSTPILNTKIKMALPQMFITFISIETFIDIAELPIDLKRAAQEL